MSEYFNRLDKDLERQPMPAEYEKYISHIFCNDCEKKTPAKYHFFYHKCGSCGSFNTTVLKTENTEETAQNSKKQQESSASSSSVHNVASGSETAAGPTIEALGLSSNSDQDQIMQPQVGRTAGNSITSSSFLGIGYNRIPPSSSSVSSSSSRGRTGAESNEG